MADAIDGVVVVRRDGLERDAMRDLALAVRDHNGIRGAVIGGSPAGGGAALIAAVRKDSGLHAAELIAEAVKLIQGGGGKNADFAMAGGKNAAGIDAALDTVRASLR